MRRNLLIAVFFLICFCQCLFAQYNQERLFPDLSGDDLLDQVTDSYKADILFFDYGTSRDTMFREVYAVNDSLECVYSGHTLYMDPDADPTTTVYMNGSKDGINTEHTYPRSKGAGFGNAKSDMHHLFPTRAMVNEERSNFPFGEINDATTTKWFWKDQALITKPTNDLDKYSEWKWQVFEPRESFKGNIARAVMYFYTMYKTQSDAEDPDFFWDMLPDLCQWHFEDPVDSAEFVRTNLIAKWQQYPNPFILDCSLATRSYCADIMNDACELAVSVEEELNNISDFQVQYDSYSEELNLKYNGQLITGGLLNIYDINGRLINKISLGFYDGINVSNLDAGTYVLQWISSNAMHSSTFVKAN